MTSINGNLDYFEAKKRELDQLRKEASENSELFWSKIAGSLTWSRPWDNVRDLSDAPITKWFAGGEMNACYDCLDRHLKEGHEDTVALYYDSPVTETKRAFTYKQLYNEVTRLAGVLKEFGAQKGDRVLIYMPMMVESVLAMLACSRIGAVHCAMPSGLPAKDLATRIDHSKPKVILTATRGYHGDGWLNYKDILDEACSAALHKPDKVLVFNRQEKSSVSMVAGRDEDWESKVKSARPDLECTPVEATEPLFVIYTSGSTGNPKGIVHPVGGYAVRMLSDSNLLTDKDEEVFYTTSNIGWIASHSTLIYMPLLTRHKLVLFEGDHLLTSDVNTLYRLIDNYGITRLLVRPGVLKILQSMDKEGETASRYNLKSLRQIKFGGERLDDKTKEWTVDVFRTTLWNSYGQTELSGLVTGGVNASCPENVPATFDSCFPYPGLNVQIRKFDQSIAKPNETGRILIKLPLPPGSLISLLDDHDECERSYFEEFPGYFDTKDQGFVDENGRLHVEGRVDNVMKHGPIYLAAHAVEQVVGRHPEVAECVVVSVPDLILEEIPVTLFVAQKGNCGNLDKIVGEIEELASKHFGEAVVFGKMIPVEALPRGRTGKIHRPSITNIINGLNEESIGAVENPQVLKDISVALQMAGYLKK